jgi:preprotein translocase subunit SecG
MTVFPLLAVSFIMKVVAVLFILCCVALVLIVLIQKGRGGGLSGAFGGAMASGILGSKTGDFLTWVTIMLAGIFLLLAVVMAKFYKPPPVTGYGVSAPAQQAPPEESQAPAPSGNTGAAGNEANSVTDMNSTAE